MKIESLFKVVDHKLFTTAGQCVSVDGMSVFVIAFSEQKSPELVAAEIVNGQRRSSLGKPVCVRISWKIVEMKDGLYDEAYLADLRTVLKLLENRSVSVIIEPFVEDGPAQLSSDGSCNEEAASRLTAAMRHVARRIKDCSSVVGFILPEEIASDKAASLEYITELSRKHPQYVFFARDIGNIASDLVVLYQM